jgi:hypothetical protein
MTKPLDLSKYKSAAGAAKALYTLVCEKAEATGMDPDIECRLMTPEEGVANGFGKEWRVMWEAGPYEWGVGMAGSSVFSFPEWETRYVGAYDGKGDPDVVGIGDGKGWYLEPYYGFDVGFAKR